MLGSSLRRHGACVLALGAYGGDLLAAGLSRLRSASWKNGKLLSSLGRSACGSTGQTTRTPPLISSPIALNVCMTRSWWTMTWNSSLWQANFAKSSWIASGEARGPVRVDEVIAAVNKSCWGPKRRRSFISYSEATGNALRSGCGGCLCAVQMPGRLWLVSHESRDMVELSQLTTQKVNQSWKLPQRGICKAVSWDDCARWNGSCIGPNITDSRRWGQGLSLLSGP